MSNTAPQTRQSVGQSGPEAAQVEQSRHAPGIEVAEPVEQRSPRDSTKEVQAHAAASLKSPRLMASEPVGSLHSQGVTRDEVSQLQQETTPSQLTGTGRDPAQNHDIAPSPSLAPATTFASPQSHARASSSPAVEEVSPFGPVSIQRISKLPSPSELVQACLKAQAANNPSGRVVEGENQGPSVASPDAVSPQFTSPGAVPSAAAQPISTKHRIQSAFASASPQTLQEAKPAAIHTSPQSPSSAPQQSPESGAGTVDPREGVSVVCNGLRGVFHTRTKMITCHCPKCSQAKTPMPDMSPTEFERHAGMAASKKWKYSIKIGNENLNMTLGTWLERQGLIKKKFIKRHPMKTNPTPAATSPGSLQHLLAAQAQMMSAGQVRLEGLTPAALSVLAARQVGGGGSEGKQVQALKPMEGLRMESMLGPHDRLYARQQHMEQEGRAAEMQEQMARRGQQMSPTGPVTPGAPFPAFPQSLSSMMQHNPAVPATHGLSPTASHAPSMFQLPTIIGPSSHSNPPTMAHQPLAQTLVRTPTLQPTPLSSHAPGMGHGCSGPSHPPAHNISPFLSHPNPTAVLHGTTTPILGLSSGSAERAKTPSRAQSPKMEGDWKPRGAFEGRTSHSHQQPEHTERSDSASDRPHWESGMTHRRSGDSTADLDVPLRPVQLMQPPLKRFRDHEKRSSGSSREQLTSNLLEAEAAPRPQIVSWLMTNGGEKLRLTVSFNGILFSGAVRNAGRMVQALDTAEQDAVMDDPYPSAMTKRPRVTPPSTPVEPSPVSSHRTNVPMHPAPDAMPHECELCHMPAGEELVAGSPRAAGPQGGPLGPLITVNVGPGIIARVHRLCMLWCPEVRVNEWTGDLDGVLEGFTRAVSTRCSACYKLGAGVSCSHPGCDHCYHVNCARRSGCVMQVEPYLVHCPEHAAQQSEEEEDAAVALMKLTRPLASPAEDPPSLSLHTLTTRMDPSQRSSSFLHLQAKPHLEDASGVDRKALKSPRQLDPINKASSEDKMQVEGPDITRALEQQTEHIQRLGGRSPEAGLRFPLAQTVPSLWQRAASGFPAALQQQWPGSSKSVITVQARPAGTPATSPTLPGRKDMDGRPSPEEDVMPRSSRQGGVHLERPDVMTHQRGVAMHERPESKGSRLEAASSDSDDEDEDEDEEEQSTSEEERMKAMEADPKQDLRPLPTLKVSTGAASGLPSVGRSHLQGVQKSMAPRVGVWSDAERMDVDQDASLAGNTLKMLSGAMQAFRQEGAAGKEMRGTSPRAGKIPEVGSEAAASVDGKGRTAVSVPALADYPPNMLLTQLHLMQAHLAAQHAQRAGSPLGDNEGTDAQQLIQAGSPRIQSQFARASLAALSPRLSSGALQLMPFVTLPQMIISPSATPPFGLARSHSPDMESQPQESPRHPTTGGLLMGSGPTTSAEEKMAAFPGFGGTTGQAGRPGRCSVCIVQRKGKCGTESAPKRCLRRILYGPALQSGATVVQSARDGQGPGPDGEAGEQVEAGCKGSGAGLTLSVD